ncbi:uncharacterized protein LOC105798176 isoform X1 [Gossypium raimondii]|uniref:Translation initiation factor 5A C-terminal domain-containing protein n=1 Tax=Gossypium raimondii TaxID=29730 RepID=A0A0D2NKH1_GOSRA|nr:uncharacterized protein LOC105798176 isoform X1 [Gossypium raimondii]KJB33537.1 hypothetical protein B456_006G016000 [Gossypium raimondii]
MKTLATISQVGLLHRRRQMCLRPLTTVLSPAIAPSPMVNVILMACSHGPRQNGSTAVSQDINSLKHIALMEAKMKKLSDLLSKTIEQTKENVVKKLALTYEEMEQECKEIMDGFAEGKDLVVSVMSAMGEWQICALKDIGPK